MTATPDTAPRYGVDFTNVRRQAFYATPKGSPRSTAPATTATSYRGATSTSFYTPTTASGTSFAFTRGGGGSNIPIGNSSRKRSRVSYQHTSSSTHNASSRIPTNSANKPVHTTSFKLQPATPRPGSRLQTHDRQQSYHTPLSQRQWSADDDTIMSAERDYATPGTVSPPPLANSRYHLSTGYDTPTAAQANAYEDGAYFSSTADSRFKRLADEGIGRHGFTAGLEGDLAEAIAGPLARKQNENGGRSRGLSSTYSGSGNSVLQHQNQFGARSGGPGSSWGIRKALFGAAVDAAVGVAGFVFDFCNSTFGGFQSGGGQKWSANGKPDIYEAPSFAASKPTSRFAPTDALDSTWHDSDYDVPLSPSPRRAAKKMKASYEDDGALPGSWIMVDRDDENESRAASPTLKSTNASPAGLRQRARPGTHKRRFGSSVGSIPAFHTASSAGLRSPGERPGSAARPRTSGGEAYTESPLGKEGERLARRQRRMQKEEDRKLDSMSSRIEDLIRQGSQALVTTYDVEMDEGF